MPRIILSLLLAPLLVITLLWGGCVACPQFFMFPRANDDCCKASHCERSKSQKTAPAKQCNRMPLDQGSAIQLLCAEPPTRTIAAIDLVRPMLVHRSASDPVSAVEHSPPDAQALYASFLI